MAIRIDIILQHQVILIVSHLDGCQEVSRLKSRFEHEGFVIVIHWLVVWLRLIRAWFPHVACPHAFEVFLLTVNIMFLDQLFDIDEVGSRAQALSGLVQGADVAVLPLFKVSYILFTKTAVHQSICLPGINQVIRNCIRRCNV